jgi:hypothetical protein
LLYRLSRITVHHVARLNLSSNVELSFAKARELPKSKDPFTTSGTSSIKRHALLIAWEDRAVRDCSSEPNARLTAQRACNPYYG